MWWVAPSRDKTIGYIPRTSRDLSGKADTNSISSNTHSTRRDERVDPNLKRCDGPPTFRVLLAIRLVGGKHNQTEMEAAHAPFCLKKMVYNTICVSWNKSERCSVVLFFFCSVSIHRLLE